MHFCTWDSTQCYPYPEPPSLWSTEPLLFSHLYPVGRKLSFNLIPDPAEFVEDLLLVTLGVGGVIEAPMETGQLSGIHRADLVGITADGDDDVDPARQGTQP